MENARLATLEDIRAEYRERYKNRSGAIVFDGIVNESRYENILFLLKEANQEGASAREKKSINESLNENAPWKMWKRTAEWVYGLSNTTPEGVPSYTSIKKLIEDKTKVQLHNEIKKIAVININKADGIGSPLQADIEKRLLDAVDKNSDLIKQEIELVKPRIIVCGGTFWYLQKVFDGRVESCDPYKSYRFADIGSLHNVLIIDFCHPAAHYSSLMTYYGITNIYQQALIDGWRK